MKSELYHHGVKGQHWGVRRYQNPDGSLTPEGRARYSKNINRSANIGAVVGAASGIGQMGLTVASIAAMGPISLASVPSLLVASGIRYAASGYLTGLAVGTIASSIQIARGKKYMHQALHGSSHFHG